MELEDFISQAGDHGCCVGIYLETVSPLVVPHGVELRLANGAYAKTLSALYETFAEIWHFPPWFGRNKEAFTDFICDLDNMIDTMFGRPPAPAYLTAINDAHLLLIEEPDSFSWFANKMRPYRDYYRDEASPPAAFGLLLSAPGDRLDEVRLRWRSAGIQVAEVMA